MRLFVGGWREVSLVDVIGSISFTIWLSRCNLRCPWCSNYRLVTGVEGRWVTVEEVLKNVSDARAFIDYLHVTGGEPLLQHKAVGELLAEARGRLGISTSVDTNGTLPRALSSLLGLLDHLAIDVKAPLSRPEKYARVTGVVRRSGEDIVARVKESIVLGAERVGFIEFRTTMVPGMIGPEDVAAIGAELEDLLRGRAKARPIYVVQQFIPYEGVRPPFSRLRATPRDVVVRAATEVAETTSLLEVYVRTMEDGTVGLKELH